MLFFGAAGSFAILGVVLMLQPPPLPSSDAYYIYGWFGLSALVGTFCGFALRRCYRAEPARWRGYWHLSLTDIFVATLFAAAWMSSWRALWPDSFLYWGASVSVAAGAALVVSLLAAAARGYTRYSVKLPLAAALLLKNYGLLAMLGLVAICALVAFLDGPGHAIELPFDVLFGSSPPSGEQWIQDSVRAGAVSLPAGWVASAYILATRRPDSQRELDRSTLTLTREPQP